MGKGGGGRREEKTSTDPHVSPVASLVLPFPSFFLLFFSFYEILDFDALTDPPTQPTQQLPASYIVFYVRPTTHLRLSAKAVSHALRARARDRIANRQSSAFGLGLLDFRQCIDNARQETDRNGL